MPYSFVGFNINSEEKSTINNWQVSIALDEAGIYHAFFMYYNVGFYVTAEGLAEDEFISALFSVIK